jgi:hypothetical protein
MRAAYREEADAEILRLRTCPGARPQTVHCCFSCQACTCKRHIDQLLYRMHIWHGVKVCAKYGAVGRGAPRRYHSLPHAHSQITRVANAVFTHKHLQSSALLTRVGKDT